MVVTKIWWRRDSFNNNILIRRRLVIAVKESFHNKVTFEYKIKKQKR